ncbi:DNA cytosine methyltransferase [Sinorhizobium meliloti]
MNVALRPEHLNIISICTGGGGLDLGLELAIQSARSVCMVEREAFAVSSLVSAMEQGLLHQAPVWSDARTFDGRAWRGAVDGLIGGIPCQPHSVAGRKKGSLDERDLWSAARRIIVQSRAWFVLIENVGGMLSAGDDEIAGAQRVFRDLSKLGFEVEGGLFTAAEVGAPHVRERIFVLAVADSISRVHERGGTEHVHRARKADEGKAQVGERGWHDFSDRGPGLADASDPRLQGSELGGSFGCRNGTEASGSIAELCRARLDDASNARGRPISVQPRRQGEARTYFNGPSLFPPGPTDDDGWRDALGRAPHLEPSVCRVADGVASHVDELRMLGNGVVPLQAAYAIRTLVTRLAARGSAGAARLVRLMEAA